MNTVIKRAWNKNKLVKVEDLTGMTFQAESGGHTFEISGVDDTGAAVSLSGTVEGRFLRADNAEIIISGTASGGKVSVTLSEACYAIPGRFLLTIYVTSNGQKVAVYAATGSVVATSGAASGSIPPLVTDSVQANTGTFGSISAGGATVNGILDVTPRRCYAALSSAGWYRVITNSGSKIAETSFIANIRITRAYNNADNELHEIKLEGVYGNVVFAKEVSKSKVLGITKVRYTYDINNGYVDFYYSLNVANTVNVDFDVFTQQTLKHSWAAAQMQSVEASPSGETVLTEYSFAANTNVARTAFTPTFSGTANPSVNNTACFYSIKDGVMYAGGRFNLASFTNGVTTVFFTLPVSLGIADRDAETIGTVFTTTKTLQLRSYGANVYITDAGGNYSGGLLNTGYWSFQIVAPIYN